jgi:hypothetical protein
LSMGMRVLRMPRIALPTFVAVPDEAWANDDSYSQSERLDRTSEFIRSVGDKPLQELKALGAELVNVHDLDVSGVTFPLGGGVTPAELVWPRGLVAEFDNPKKYSARGRFLSVVRELIAEWADLDSLAACHAYGIDTFCTEDRARGAGNAGILHPDNRRRLLSEFGVTVLPVGELVSRL